MPIYYNDSASFQIMEVSASLKTAPSSIVDFSPATYVSGTFRGSGNNLTHITASYIVVGSNVTASTAISADVADSAYWATSSLFATASISSIWASGSAYASGSRVASSSWFASSSLNASTSFNLSGGYVSASAIHTTGSIDLEYNNTHLMIQNTSQDPAVSVREFKIGFDNETISHYNDNFIIGIGNSASLFVGGVVGVFNTVPSGEDTWVIGQNNIAGNADTIFGVGNNTHTVSGNGRILLGRSNNATDEGGATFAVLVGHSNTATADYAVALGVGLTNGTASSVEIGVGDQYKTTFAQSGVLFRVPITASRLVGTASFATSASYAPGGNGMTLQTGSSYPITASQAVSASWAPSSGPGTSLQTGSTYPITSSWSEWATNALNGPPSSIAVSASWASSSLSSSYASYAEFAQVTASTVVGSNVTFLSASVPKWRISCDSASGALDFVYLIE